MKVCECSLQLHRVQLRVLITPLKLLSLRLQAVVGENVDDPSKVDENAFDELVENGAFEEVDPDDGMHLDVISA